MQLWGDSRRHSVISDGYASSKVSPFYFGFHSEVRQFFKICTANLFKRWQYLVNYTVYKKKLNPNYSLALG